MDTSQKVSYNMACKYIQNKDDRIRYLVNRKMLFNLYDNLYEYFDTDYDE
jgi:hypothetical protein